MTEWCSFVRKSMEWRKQIKSKIKTKKHKIKRIYSIHKQKMIIIIIIILYNSAFRLVEWMDEFSKGFIAFDSFGFPLIQLTIIIAINQQFTCHDMTMELEILTMIYAFEYRMIWMIWMIWFLIKRDWKYKWLLQNDFFPKRLWIFKNVEFKFQVINYIFAPFQNKPFHWKFWFEKSQATTNTVKMLCFTVNGRK